MLPRIAYVGGRASPVGVGVSEWLPSPSPCLGVAVEQVRLGRALRVLGVFPCGWLRVSAGGVASGWLA